LQLGQPGISVWFGRVDAVRLCACAPCTLAFAAMVDAKWKGSRSSEVVLSTNAQALTAVIAEAHPAMARRLSPAVTVFMAFSSD